MSEENAGGAGDGGRRRRRRRRGGGGQDEGVRRQASGVGSEPDQPRPPRQEPRPPRQEPRPPRQEPRRAEPPRAQRESSPLPDARRLTPDASPSDDDAPAESSAPAIPWGKDDDGPPAAVTLVADLPADAPADDPDPLTWPLAAGPGSQLGEDVANVVGVRFVAAGRMQWCDAGEGEYELGERVLVDSDRGQRLATIATAIQRRPSRARELRRVIRRANEQDLRVERNAEADGASALRAAKDVAAALDMPVKVFRVEKSGGRLLVYYTSDERLDVRDFVRDLAAKTSSRIELRQLGARDEAKVVGGIGSCGLTLCCTTWLPEFVPVSIKMAKDQGLVLSPTKVAGQCGRLKCCLVYEQAAYAELRKGLPKLGKRVIAPRGEGRVVEVDVLRQRVRVSYAPGESEVLPATDVKPMFPSGGQRPEPEPEPEPEPDSGETES